MAAQAAAAMMAAQNLKDEMERERKMLEEMTPEEKKEYMTDKRHKELMQKLDNLSWEIKNKRWSIF